MKRRKFVQLGALTAGSMAFSVCTPKERQNNPSDLTTTPNPEPDALTLSKSMPKDHVFNLLDEKVVHYMQVSHNCAQSSFLALSEQFGLGNKEMVKALTPLPGIAERGETCGAVTGALLALGLVFGRENLNDWEAYRESLIPANDFCDRFEKEMGSTMCSAIIEKFFGERYDLRDPDDLSKFQENDATHKCSIVVQTAVRIAADIILTV
jgi:C_GCAxxG_C_C family probable redox protein